MRRYHYLHRSKLTSAISSSELSFRDMAWALHSESQDLLIEYSTMASGGKFFWKDARVHGIFLWIRDSGPVLTSIFKEHIIPFAVKTGDRWLAKTLCDADQTVPESQISTSNSPDAALIVLYKQLKEKSVQTLRGAAEISAETEFFFVLRTIFAYDRIGCPLLALHLVKSWTFPPEEVSLSKNPNHILKSRRRTTILDIPLPNDDPISSGVVSIDTWSWDPPITPTSPEASKSITDKAIDAFSDEPQHIRHQRVGSFSRKTSLDFNNNSLNNEDDDNNIWSWNSPKSFQNYVKRLAQQLLNAVEIISKDPELFNNSSYYSDYINKLEQGLSSICKSVKIIYIIINLKSLFLSFTRCLETDAYDLLEHFKSYKEDNKSKKSSSAYS
ncbi:6097_t:CDS:2 [Entrophospora sp. SA101]|nr:6097_t:CDS:2 [Entrophospora sp. SA101]CAJ0846416.1 5524_t:CDS:2 [Entrophospora sp. SA101]